MICGGHGRGKYCWTMPDVATWIEFLGGNQGRFRDFHTFKIKNGTHETFQFLQRKVCELDLVQKTSFCIIF